MRKKSEEDQGSKSVDSQGERVGYGGKRNVVRLDRKESREVRKGSREVKT